jgi:hypothetical protein
MNILILHHFSDCWNDSFKHLGTSYDEELEKVLDYIKNEDLDKVIITSTKSTELEACHDLIKKACDYYAINLEIHNYGFGWSRDSKELKELYPIDKMNQTWCNGGRESIFGDDIVKIEKWQHELKGNNVRIAGAFENECILDLTTALEAIDISYVKERGMIVGLDEEYTFRTLSKKDLEESLRLKLSILENKIKKQVIEINTNKNVNIKNLKELSSYNEDFVFDIEEKFEDFYRDNESDFEYYQIYKAPVTGMIDSISSESFSSISIVEDLNIEEDFVVKEFLENKNQFTKKTKNTIKIKK